MTKIIQALWSDDSIFLDWNINVNECNGLPGCPAFFFAAGSASIADLSTNWMLNAEDVPPLMPLFSRKWNGRAARVIFLRSVET